MDLAGLPSIKALLLDIDGVICVGGRALPGSIDAVRRLGALRIPLKFVTNTTRRPRRRIVEDLALLGLAASQADVLTPSAMARDFLTSRKLAPFLVTHPDLREDFAGLEPGAAEAVVVGDAGEFFTYDLLNEAYRKLVHGADFLALAKNRNFLDRDHELSLDAGPFAAALEFASGRTATVLGKPASAFFLRAVEDLGCAPSEAVMIGDDAEADVGGAMAAGLKGVLVRTGKYRTGQEDLLAARPTFVADNLEAAVEWLLG
ncbi:TIGR01458 family HAD-type hydrolase [Methylocapsa palsarum]|uniref:Phospholysine phosphohistidine inorganic pyrophosphate phosphatase n=1 Tax=Methylocapsa palsarum TaxID=1612308 RepID=A0A1I4A5V2_9HYPH|nr:TIGR01458 family HAD-type hydrolase [Methylocapsa palsarum]SFK51728.1 HAD-superfamily subfamily IIA hydrolase, TIGR01458 [Methylocapsa palsarum]